MNTMKQYATKIVPMLVLVTMLAGGQSMSVNAKGGEGNGNTGVINTPAGSSYGIVDTAGNLIGQGTTNCQNCAGGAPQVGGTGGGGTGGFGGGGGTTPPPGTPPPPPPPPPACAITLDKQVIPFGATTVTLSWQPIPTTNVSLKRQKSVAAVALRYSQHGQQATILLAGGGGSPAPVPPPPPPPPVPVGTILVAPPSSAQSFTDMLNETQEGVITYILSYSSPGTPLALTTGGGVQPIDNRSHGANGRQLSGTIILAGGGGGTPPPPPPPPPITYQCSKTVKVVRVITECNDGIDNADTEDTLLDQQDPGCHTDGNPTNVSTYDPARTSETNTPADLVAHVQAPMYATEQSPLTVIISGENISPTYASTNDLVYGWRNTSVAPSCTGWGSLFGNRCFTSNGQTYMKVNTFSSAYSARQLLGAGATTFLLPSQGTYEVCAVADYTNVIPEGSSGESNNSACQTVRVLPALAVITGGPAAGTITGPLTLIVSPTRVRRGNSTTLAWDTGGRTKCTITGTNGQTINLIGAASAASVTTSPITAETTYTLSCADDASSIQSKVKLIAQYQEI